MVPVFAFIFCYVFSGIKVLEAFPTEEVQGHYEDRMRESSAAALAATTTEAANRTGIISSVWRKFSNIFTGETTTQADLEMRQEVLMPEDRRPPSGHEEGGRDLRMSPEDFSRQGEGEAWKKGAYDEGNLYPIHPQLLRMKRSDRDRSFYEKKKQPTEVRPTASTEHHKAVKFETKGSSDLVVNRTVPITIEEFDQGYAEGGRIKRFKDSQKSTDWITEKIIVGSDPVENMDNTNYIEEIKNSDFPFHSFSIKPIIVQDTLPEEMTTFSQRELPPLKIIEY